MGHESNSHLPLDPRRLGRCALKHDLLRVEMDTDQEGTHDGSRQLRLYGHFDQTADEPVRVGPSGFATPKAKRD